MLYGGCIRIFFHDMFKVHAIEGGIAMRFWIFILLMDLLIPLTMIGFGRYFLENAPKEINAIFGYRTTMSIKNRATWIFAHHCCGKIWYVSGIISLIITIIVIVTVMGQTENTIGTVGGIICGVQILLLIGSIIPTEKALKRTFDRNGNRR